jgi:hypothetical protein
MMLGVQLHFSCVQALIEQVAPIENDEMASRKKPKSTSGLWTSSWREETKDSEWVEWCRGENFSNPDESQWFLLTPKEHSRLYVIDCYADLERLLETYLWELPEIKRLSELSYLRRYYRGIDFERLSQDYDGLHLTSHGNEDLHHGFPLDMNAWDSESTVWFRWCFTKVEKIAPVIAQEVQ